MAKINESSPEGTKKDFDKGVYHLLFFYRQLTQLLETFFGGCLIIFTDEINSNYLRLGKKVNDILKKTGVCKFCKIDAHISLKRFVLLDAIKEAPIIRLSMMKWNIISVYETLLLSSWIKYNDR